MNVMKRIHLITLIIFVITSHVLGSEIFKRADDSQCINQGGQCMNPNNCTGTVKSGLCPGGNDNKCCIPSAPKPSNTQNKPNNTNDGSKCTNQGGQCMNPDNCTGTVKSGLCPGGNDNKCCIPSNPKTTSQQTNTTQKTNSIQNDSKCKNLNGQCMNPNNCRNNNGIVLNNLCPGGSDNKCCILSEQKTNTQKTNSIQNDSKCTSQGGQCMNPSSCRSNNGTVKNNLCPGGNDNKCCILPKGNTNTQKTNSIQNDSKCKNLNGQCMNPTYCRSNNGTVINKLCPGGNDNKCCILPKRNTNTQKTNIVQNDSKCTSQGGQCMNPSSCRSNNGTVKNNLCPGGNDNKCCILPKGNTNTQKTNTVQNNNKCTSRGGQCMNPTYCRSNNGTVINKLCPGGNDNKCCILPKRNTNTQKTNIVQNDSICTNQGGYCMNPSICRINNGTVKNNLCPGGSNNKCCILPKRNTNTQKTNIVQNDSKCTNQGGQCMNPSSCRINKGTVKNNLCPGDSNNKCCILPKGKTNTQKTNTSTSTTNKGKSSNVQKEQSELCPGKNIVIDVSYYQDIKDYDTLAKMYEGVIIRLGDFQGDSDPDIIDEKWETFYDNLKEKTKIGFYFFTRARTPDRIKEHVGKAYNMIKGLSMDFPLYIDMETIDTYTNNKYYNKPNIFHLFWNKKDDNTEIALAGIKEIQRLGVTAGLYTNLFNNSLLDYDKIKDTGASIWIAKYSKTKPKQNCDMWQFEEGEIDKSIIADGVVDKSCLLK